MSSHGPSVLVFDSGVGGLSIARSIWQRLPDARLVYVADNACFPYGDQPESLVVQRCVALIEAVVAQIPVDMVVIGCNTASTVVLPALRAVISQPVVGVVPAIKPAAALSKSRRIGLLATPATVCRPYLDQLVKEFAPTCQIVRVGSSELVQMVEGSLASGRVETSALTQITAPFREAAVDTVVLGCTHFPLIRSALANTMAADTVWVDSGDAIARRVESLWLEAVDRGEGRGAVPLHEHRLLFTGAAPVGLEAYLTREAIAPCRITDSYPLQSTSGR